MVYDHPDGRGARVCERTLFEEDGRIEDALNLYDQKRDGGVLGAVIARVLVLLRRPESGVEVGATT